MNTTKIALILGATGGVGHETALAFSKRGWRIRALHRDPARVASSLPEAEWVAGDTMNARDVLAAADGAALIVHGVNPPGYRNWERLALPMLENTIAAARSSDARIIFPGTVYNYGPDAFPLLSESMPQKPRTRKGAIRVAMERRLQRASEEANVRVLILRGGDFFGPNMGNSWFSQALVKPGAPFKAITYPGRPEVGHAWAYLPDFAETIARLVERDEALGTFETYHFGGHWFERGIEIAERVRTVARAPGLPIRRFPWVAVVALSPFVQLFRELAEMRYLWTTAVRLDNSKLRVVLGGEPHTDIDLALHRTLAALGCAAAPVLP
ncbi:NAD-dependent epimerase/dehydratase family protein [Chelativorans alearense]|uniref:NAD-dependent epimerase/dehydratase family protein n=1 Tax=Chelativorans alearense TaxID=2681495 RepID=UPI0013D2CE79|nr:NAD-dependent epimerase/dehydratase family protein [Chelativorans alearense]